MAVALGNTLLNEDLMDELSDEAFRDALEGVLKRSRLSRRRMSVLMGRDEGYVAALLDPTRPSRARPTPTNLLALSDATGMPLADLFADLWGIPRWRLARGRSPQKAASELELVIARLGAAGRRSVMDYATYLANRMAVETPPSGA